MYSFTQEGAELHARVRSYLEEFAYPRQDDYRAQREEVGPNGYVPLLDELKAAARSRGLWNLFLPHLAPDAPGTRLSNLDYAPISEQLGKMPFASEALNCSAPDTGNMEILNLYGSERVKKEWLAPLLEGEIRCAFSMTEPDAASSDATNIELRIERDGDEYVLNGTKWFTSGALLRALQGPGRDGKTNPMRPRHRQQSMIVVPQGHPGRVLRPHPARIRLRRAGRPPEIIYENVRVPADYLLGEEGGGFAISQARLGPGRIHHCMRAIGAGRAGARATWSSER